jgi:hypothetical protein
LIGPSWLLCFEVVDLFLRLEGGWELFRVRRGFLLEGRLGLCVLLFVCVGSKSERELSGLGRKGKARRLAGRL